MLVRLTSSTSGEMVMFANHARALFAWMDKECTARGVFTLEQLSAAATALRHGIEAEKKEARQREAARRRGEAPAQEDDEAEEATDQEATVEETVTLAQRALPLLHLLERTQHEGGFILWEAPRDF